MNYMIAMSGGVDSSVALSLIKKSMTDGDSVIGATLALSEKGNTADEKNISDARAVCENQGVEHTSLYAYDEFRKNVIDYFTSSYLRGETPNPCVICNREIKFGLLYDYAKKQGYDSVVTGHYARLAQYGGYAYIRRAADLKKDQSYVLAMLTNEQVCAARFPLGEYTKDMIREIAEENGFVNAHRHDSQDICFIPDGDYVAFMKKLGLTLPGEGNYLDTNGNVIGKHKGHINYTIGQRKGLGISLGKHAFVISKNAEKNEVVLGDEDGIFRKKVYVRDLNLPSDPKALDGETRVAAKLRYAHKPSLAVFTRTGEHEGYLTFDEAQRAPSCGQFAVMYTPDAADGNEEVSSLALVLGGAKII